MKKKLGLFFYIVIVAVFGTVIYSIVMQGHALEKARGPLWQAVLPANHFTVFTEAFHHNLIHPLPVLLLQIIVIVVVARLFGFLFSKIKQPAVIGEIVAGIVLGPSLLGLLFPQLSHFLFPAASLGNLKFMSQVGLILFMFVIGMELDTGIIGKQAYGAVIISHASIIIPYALGMSLAFFLYREFASETVSFLSFALFMGIAMSITAFPVLARIIQGKGLTKTNLGALAITCAAADDITAWCILAAVIAIVKAGSPASALFTITIALCYVLVMLFAVKPLLKKLGNIYAKSESVKRPVMAFVFMILLLSAYCTEVIGIHALFGAFLAGVIMPAELDFRKMVIDKIEDVSVVLLLPLFFVFTGLRTQIGLLGNTHLWAVCGWITLTAVTGKVGGSALAARIVGQSWKDSLSIGALMNTRGLMELIVLNIGYDLGILSPEIFTMMVLMALATTFMTGPALDLINWMKKDKSKGSARIIRKQTTLKLKINNAIIEEACDNVDMPVLAKGIFQVKLDHFIFAGINYRKKFHVVCPSQFYVFANHIFHDFFYHLHHTNPRHHRYTGEMAVKYPVRRVYFQHRFYRTGFRLYTSDRKKISLQHNGVIS